MGTDPVTRELQKGARELERNAKALQYWSGVATEVQVAAVRAIENLIVALELREESYRALRLMALWELGRFLLLVRRGKGRPRKPENVLSEHFSRAPYRQLGIKPHIAKNALLVGAIPAEVLREFLALDPAERRRRLGSKSDPTIAGLVRYATRSGVRRTGGFILTHPDLQAQLEEKYGELVDVFPHPRPPGYDALQISWAELKKDKPHAALYVNAPFLKGDWDYGYGFAGLVRKCIEEAQKGVGPIILVMPTRSTMNMLFEARQIIDVEMESLGRPVWLHAETHEEQPSPGTITLFELNKKPTPLIPVVSARGLRGVEREMDGPPISDLRHRYWKFPPLRGISDYVAN
jgi:hypothetical protein